jgi:hypothetical protein
MKTKCPCGAPVKALPGIDCLHVGEHRPRRFGSPARDRAGEKHRIVLWQQGLTLEGPRWNFVVVENDDYDTIVDEAWMKKFYSTSQYQMQVMLETEARRCGLSDRNDTL